MVLQACAAAFLVAALFGFGAATDALRAAECTTDPVDTTLGEVCGLAREASAADGSGTRPVASYLGIPYAASPVGPARWAPPVPAAPYHSPFTATAFGPACPQHKKSAAPVPQSEDCLSLNVWSPSDPASEPLPVMVFIYGGSFVDGSASLPLYDGSRLAASGRVVVVTLNYRIGALGFLGGLEKIDGNFGFQDQQLALQWVRDNIGRFGGDPDRVTLFGESAGAMSVALHLVSPGSQGLFHQVIMESNPYGIPYKTPKQARRFAESFALELGCPLASLDCMRKAAVDDVLSAQASVLTTVQTLINGFAGELAWGPTIDGDIIPTQPLGTPIVVPAIVGTNRNEGVLFVSGERIDWFGRDEIPAIEYDALVDLMFPSGTIDALQKIERYRKRNRDNTDALAHILTDYLFACPNLSAMRKAMAPVYGYRFNHVPSFNVWPPVTLCAPSEKKVCHTFELPFVFGNPTTAIRVAPAPDDRFTPEESMLSRQMAAYWIRFAETGDPNHDKGVAWPAFASDPPVRLMIRDVPETSRDPGHHCGMWDDIGYDNPGLFDRLIDRL